MADNPQEKKPSIATDGQEQDTAAESTENSLVSRIQRRLQTKQGNERTSSPTSIARSGLNAAATRTRLNRVQRAADRSTVWHPDAGAAPSMITRFADTIVERFPDTSGKYQVQRQAPNAGAPSSFVFASHGNTASTPTSIEEEDTSDVQTQQISLEEIRRKISEKAAARKESDSAPPVSQAETPKSQPSQPVAIQPQPNQSVAPAAIRRRPLSRIEEVSTKPTVSQTVGRSTTARNSSMVSRAAASSEDDEQTEPVVQRQVAPPVTLGDSSSDEESSPIQTKPMVARAAAAPSEEEKEAPRAVQPKRIARAATPEEEETPVQAKPLVARAATAEEPEEQTVAPKRIARAATPEEEETPVQAKPLVARAAVPAEGSPQDEEKAHPPLATAASFLPTKTSDDDKAAPAVHRKASDESTATTSSPLINRSTDLPLTAKAQRSPITQRVAPKSTPDVLPLLLHQPVQKQAARQSISRQSMPMAQGLARQTQTAHGNVQRSPEALSRVESLAASNQDEPQNTQLPLAAVSRSPIAQRQSTTRTDQAVVHRAEAESTGAGNASAPAPEEPKDALDLDKLARDVYPIIKRMFAIENERSHSRY